MTARIKATPSTLSTTPSPLIRKTQASLANRINPGKGSAVYPDGTDKAGLTDTVDRTISYKMSDGSKAPASVKDSLTFTASKEIDKVTGKVLYRVEQEPRLQGRGKS